MANELDGFEPAAIHMLRRLLSGETVKAEPYNTISGLIDARDRMARAGYVYQKGYNFELTARGRSLSSALALHDISAGARANEKLRKAEADRRARQYGPALLAVLVELVAAAGTEALDFPDAEGYAAAVDRNNAAWAAADEILKTVTVQP